MAELYDCATAIQPLPTFNELHSEWPRPATTGGSLAVAQRNVPNQGFYPGSYEYKYSHPKWHNVTRAQNHNGVMTRDFSERNRIDTNLFAGKIVQRIDRNQADCGLKIRDRFQDIQYWKEELKRTIADLSAEIDLLGFIKTRLEKALRMIEIPVQINLDNMHTRDRRIMPDRVDDPVDQNLYKEMVLLRSIQELLRKMIIEANEELRKLRDVKELCEFDWSDKWEAANIGLINSRLKNTSRNIIMRHGAAIPMPNASTLEEWIGLSRSNINAAEVERAASVRLRAIIEGTLNDVCRDMRDQADNVEAALSDRVGELEEALQKLEHNRDKILDEITATEKVVCELQRTYEMMEQPLKVNQTRLDNRKYRPGIELCKDLPQFSLLDEHAELMEALDSVLKRIAQARSVLDRLEQTRMDLEKDISIKINTLFIDRQKVRPARSKFPAFTNMLGFD